MLKKVLDELRETEKKAKEIVAGDLRTRPGRQEVQRQAVAALPGLREKFRKEFKSIGFPIFVNGPRAQEFGSLVAADVDSALVVDLRKSTMDVRTATHNAISDQTREFTPFAFSVLIRELRQLGYRLGLKSIPNLDYGEAVYLKTPEKEEAVLDNYLYRETGPEFVATVLEYDAGTEALRLTGEEKIVPVVILGVPQDLVQSVATKMFRGKYLECNVTEPVSEEKVVEVLSKVAEINGLTVQTNVEV